MLTGFVGIMICAAFTLVRSLVLKNGAVKRINCAAHLIPSANIGNTQDTGNLVYLKLFLKHTVVRLWYESGTTAVLLEDNSDMISFIIEV